MVLRVSVVLAIRLPVLVLVTTMIALLPPMVPVLGIGRAIMPIMPATTMPLAVTMPALMLVVIVPVTKMPPVTASVAHCRRGQGQQRGGGDAQ